MEEEEEEVDVGGGGGEEEVVVESEGEKGVAEVQVLERVLEVRLHSHLVSPRFRQLEELAQDLQQKLFQLARMLCWLLQCTDMVSLSMAAS